MSNNGTEPAVYAILLNWPKTNSLKLSRPVTSHDTKVSLLGYPGQLEFKPITGGGINIHIPPIPGPEMPCQWAWALRLTGLKNHKTKLTESAFATMVQSIQMRKKDLFR